MIFNFYHYKINGVLLLIIYLIVSVNTFAQTGTLRGHVYDKSTNEILLGANVTIKNTSLGAATDVYGNYFIRNIPGGNQSILVSYIGYQSITIDVNILSDKTVEHDFYLMPSALEGQTVTVTAQAEGQLSAINQQITSNTIENVVSKARLQELPDVNAAESIGRLPGVSLQRYGGEATKVEVRGLNPKYNLITVNGVIIPGTGSSDRSVDLSLVSSNMLDGISLKKVTTPDMDADVLGGTIDLRLKEAPSGFKLFASAQGGYNALQKYYRNYNFNLSVSDRFLEDRLGVIVNLNTDNYDRSADKLQATYGAIGNSTTVTALANQELNLREEQVNRKRTGASFLLDYIIPNGKITADGFFNQLNSKVLNHVNDLWTPNASYSSNRIYYQLEQTGGKTNIYTSMLGAHQNFNWIKYDASIGKTGSLNDTPDDRIWQFVQELGASAFPSNVIGPNTNLKDIPKLANVDTNYTWLSQIVVNSKRVMENSLSGQFNVEVPFALNEQLNGSFKTGAKFRRISRSNNENQDGAKNLNYGNTPNPNGAISLINTFFPNLPIDSLTTFWGGLPINPFLTNYTRSNFLDGDYPLGLIPDVNIMNLMTDSLKKYRSYWLNFSIPSLGYDYSGIENYQAVYIMGEFNISKYITIIPGVRWEAENTTYNGQRYRQIVINGSNEAPPADLTYLSTERNNSFWLPMINIIVRPTDWLQLKLARTENLSHPDYLQYVPITNISSDQSAINATNTELRTSRSVNYDALFSVFQNDIGYFSVDGFYKRISDLIFNANFKIQPGIDPPAELHIPESWVQGNSPTIYTYLNNPNPAKYYGIELEWQTHFWYLPSVLKGLVLNINYTHIYSEMYLKYDTTYVASVTGRPPFQIKKYALGPAEVKTRMPDQPSNVLNITLGYDLEGFSTRISYLYTADKLTGIGYSGIYPSPVKSSYTGKYERWDIAIQQKLNQHLQFYINLNNLNSRPDKNYTGFGLTDPQYFEYYGFSMDLGVRYNL